MHPIHGVHPGDYVTDGVRLAEVAEVGMQGYVRLRDCVDEEPFGASLAELRRAWWFVPVTHEQAA